MSEDVPECPVCGKPLLDEPCSLYHASQRLGWVCLEYARWVDTALKEHLDRWASRGLG